MNHFNFVVLKGWTKKGDLYANECWHFSPNACLRFSIWTSRCILLLLLCRAEGRSQQGSFCFGWLLYEHVLLREVTTAQHQKICNIFIVCL